MDSQLTHARLLELLHYDPETGVFTWKVNVSNRMRAGAVAGTFTAYGHIQIKVAPCLYRAHRLAWFYATGKWPNGALDHIDGIAANNRLANLRLTTHSLNAQNLHRPHRDNATGLLGVTWDKRRKKFIAQIQAGGRRNVYLGGFDCPNAAHQVYLEAKRRLHPGCTI